MNEYEYLSDQALEALIARSEEQGLLSAPRELKADLLARAQANPPQRARSARKNQFAAYCLRVAVATAACLTLLFVGGKGAGQLMQDTQHSPAALSSTAQRFSAFTDQLEEGYQDLNQKLSQFFINFDFGGNRHE